MVSRITRFHSSGKFVGTKESVNIRKELNSHRIGLVHQHGRDVIYQTQERERVCVSLRYPNTEKRVGNKTRSGVFLTKFKVFR